MAFEAVALTNFDLKAGGNVAGRVAPVACKEVVLGRDVSADGLLLPKETRQRVEMLASYLDVDRLATLQDNWDGYGAIRIDGDTIKNTKAALASILRAAPAPEIAPNPNGTISLEWETQRGTAHLEIGKTRFGFYLKPVGEQGSVFDGDPRGALDGLGAVIAAVLFPPVKSAVAITKLAYTAGNEQRGY